MVHIDNLATGKQIDYVAAGGMTIARVENNVPTYLHMDHLGSALAGTNTAGNVAWTEQVSPFGITANNPSANDDKGVFTGHIRDADTGLSYMQARYYDPVMGRFLAIDPVGYSGGVNTGQFGRYTYTFNNPVNLIDPDGGAPNQAGATDYRVIQSQIASTGTLSPLSGNKGNINRYFLTKKYGWVDARHFGTSATITSKGTPGVIVKLLGVGVEVKQFVSELRGKGYKSGFSPEDLPSNSAGVDFAKYYKKYLKVYPDASLADAFGGWIEKVGDYDSTSDEYQGNYNSLPSTDPSARKDGTRGSNSRSTTGPNSSVKANSSASASTSNSAAAPICRGTKIGNIGTGSIC